MEVVEYARFWFVLVYVSEWIITAVDADLRPDIIQEIRDEISKARIKDSRNTGPLESFEGGDKLIDIFNGAKDVLQNLGKESHEMTVHGRHIAYETHYRLHSADDGWVWDCKIMDVVSGVMIKVRHRKKREEVIEEAVRDLFKELKKQALLTDGDFPGRHEEDTSRRGREIHDAHDGESKAKSPLSPEGAGEAKEEDGLIFDLMEDGDSLGRNEEDTSRRGREIHDAHDGESNAKSPLRPEGAGEAKEEDGLIFDLMEEFVGATFHNVNLSVIGIFLCIGVGCFLNCRTHQDIMNNSVRPWMGPKRPNAKSQSVARELSSAWDVADVDDKELVELATAIGINQNLRRFGLSLGFKSAQVEMFEAENRIDGKVSSLGTLRMIDEWRDNIPRHERRLKLKIALEESRLAGIAEEFFGEGKDEV